MFFAFFILYSAEHGFFGLHIDELPEGGSDTLPHSRTQALIKNGNGENGKRGSRISELSNAKPEEAMQCESAFTSILGKYI